MATLDLQIATGNDDVAHQNDVHSYSVDGTHLGVGRQIVNTRYRGGGMRFAVAIGQGDTIDVGYITFNPWASDSGGSASGNLNGEDTDNASQLNDSTYEGHTKTTANVGWGFGAWVADVEITGLSMITVLQEIVDRSGWSSGNYMNLFLEDDDNDFSNGSGENREWHSYESDTAKASKLHLEFSASGIPAHAGSRGSRGRTGGFWFK